MKRKSKNITLLDDARSGIDIVSSEVQPFRILLVDDDLTTGVQLDKLFKNTSAQVEIEIAYSRNHAKQLIEMAAQEGKRFDMVDVDYFLGTQWAGGAIKSGLPSLRFLMKLCESLPASVQPKQFCLHSKADLDDVIAEHAPELEGKILTYRSEEWDDIEAHGQNYKYSDRLEGRTTDLRNYFNQTIGTDFPLSTLEMELRKKPDDKLDLHIVHDAIERGLLTKHAGLLRLKPQKDIASWFSPHANEDYARKKGIQDDQYRESEGPDIVGKVAFNAEQISTLRAQDQIPILFLKSFEPSQTRLLEGVGGIVSLGKDTEHLRTVAANHGVKAVMHANYDGWAIEQENGNSVYVCRDYSEKKVYAQLRYGADVTLGGSHVYHGKVPFWQLSGDNISKIIGWQKEVLAGQNVLAVKANADTLEQVRKAIKLGADGIGLMRTELMFFQNDRLPVLQTALLTNDDNERNIAFAKLKDCQTSDFREMLSAISTAARPFPVIIRLLDAQTDKIMDAAQIPAFVQKYGSADVRGVQLAERVRGLYAMQAEAILQAAKEVKFDSELDIMVPTIRTVEEFRAAKHEVADVAEKLGMTGQYHIRAMIETLPAIADAEAISQEAAGRISFGTNDLTSESMGGVARNDLIATREWMARKNINHVGKSPFLRLSAPVKDLIKAAITSLHSDGAPADISICGHQVAGEEDSIEFCHQIGMNSISVPASPQYYYPSRFYAGQAAIISPH